MSYQCGGEIAIVNVYVLLKKLARKGLTQMPMEGYKNGKSKWHA